MCLGCLSIPAAIVVMLLFPGCWGLLAGVMILGRGNEVLREASRRRRPLPPQRPINSLFGWNHKRKRY